MVMKSRAHEAWKNVAGPCVVDASSLLPLAGPARVPAGRIVGRQHRPVRVDVELHAAHRPGADQKLGQLQRVQARAGHVNQCPVRGEAQPRTPLVLDTGDGGRA